MIRTTKRCAALYIAAIVVAWPQPGSAHAQEKPESSLSALFPVAGHAVGLSWQATGVRIDAATFSSGPRLGRQPVDNDADRRTVFAATALGAVAGEIGMLYILFKNICWHNCRPNEGRTSSILAVALGVSLPAVTADLAGGHGPWALLGSAIGMVGGAVVGSSLEGYPGIAVYMGTHATTAAFLALK